MPTGRRKRLWHHENIDMREQEWRKRTGEAAPRFGRPRIDLCRSRWRGHSHLAFAWVWYFHSHRLYIPAVPIYQALIVPLEDA